MTDKLPFIGSCKQKHSQIIYELWQTTENDFQQFLWHNTLFHKLKKSSIFNPVLLVHFILELSKNMFVIFVSKNTEIITLSPLFPKYKQNSGLVIFSVFLIQKKNIF